MGTDRCGRPFSSARKTSAARCCAVAYSLRIAGHSERRSSARYSLPVHSAHVGQELEVYYRYHPYFGRNVLVRRIAQRATGQFLSVQGPAGIVVLIAGWMLDPVICAGMTIGAPRVDLATLVELKRLLIGLATPAHSQSDVGIVREESNEVSQIAGAGAEPTNETPIGQKPAGWGGTRRAEQDHLGAGSNPHAGGRPAGRGA
jgi:hypothetical protein